MNQTTEIDLMNLEPKKSKEEGEVEKIIRCDDVLFSEIQFTSPNVYHFVSIFFLNKKPPKINETHVIFLNAF